MIALVFSKQKLRNCLTDSSPDKLKLDMQSGNTQAKSILSSCDQYRELLYKFKELRLDAFMSKKHNVILLEYYLQKYKEHFGSKTSQNRSQHDRRSQKGHDGVRRKAK